MLVSSPSWLTTFINQHLRQDSQVSWATAHLIDILLTATKAVIAALEKSDSPYNSAMV